MSIRKWFGNPVIATGIVINAFIMLLAILVANSPAQLNRLVTEDGIVEWMQFLVFAMTSGLLGYAAIEYWQREGRISLRVLALAGLCLVVGAAAMEEISWFQRILHVQSPDFFVQNNRQGETNLHNLALGSGSIHKTLMLKVILLVGLTHNIVLPFLARSRPGIRAFVEKFGLYLPPLPASVIYIVLVILSHLLIEHPRKGELGEVFGAVHYMATVFSAYYLGLGYGQSTIMESPSDSRRVAKLFGCLMAFLLLTAWLLSAGAGAQID